MSYTCDQIGLCACAVHGKVCRTGHGYTQKIIDLEDDRVAAIVSYGVHLKYRASMNWSCSLHVLPEDLGCIRVPEELQQRKSH
jgi:hypothetical protein